MSRNCIHMVAAERAQKKITFLDAENFSFFMNWKTFHISKFRRQKFNLWKLFYTPLKNVFLKIFPERIFTTFERLREFSILL